jgi:REP-associated tyrosine transposase
VLFGLLLPEHVHLLIGEPRKGNPSKLLQVLKQRVSRALRGKRLAPVKQLRLPFSAAEQESPAFWQRRFYDFNVWSEKKVREKLIYMHKNPVARKLVIHPKDWPWSSWSHYAKRDHGLIDHHRSHERKNQPKRKSAPLKIKGCATQISLRYFEDAPPARPLP